jgi:hypothetical protein
MRRICIWIGLLVTMGCQGNQPMNFDPFAPAGSALMPPPATGAAGRSDPYYRPSLPPPSATGAMMPNGQVPSSSQYARFTSQGPDYSPAPSVVADSRASYSNSVPPAASYGSGAAANWAPPTTTPVAAPLPTTMNNSQPNWGWGTPRQPPAINPSASNAAQPMSPQMPAQPPTWSNRY